MVARKSPVKKAAKKSAKPKARGRPTKYDKKFCELAYNYCLLGATDAQLAEFFSVNEDTINNWKKKYPDFSESLKKGKIIADMNVAKSLYNRARGYNCPTVKFATHKGEITDRVEYIEHYPPDVTACIFWLKNRSSDRWKEKVEHTGAVPIKIAWEGEADDDV